MNSAGSEPWQEPGEKARLPLAGGTPHPNITARHVAASPVVRQGSTETQSQQDVRAERKGSVTRNWVTQFWRLPSRKLCSQEAGLRRALGVVPLESKGLRPRRGDGVVSVQRRQA